MDNLIAEISEKNKSLDKLQGKLTEVDMKLNVAQQNASLHHTEINYLKEIKEGLVQKLKNGQDELQTLKEDKATYKQTVDFIVTRDRPVKKSVLSQAFILQRKITDLKKDLERVHTDANDYKKQSESLREEKRDIEQRLSQLQDAIKEENTLHKTNVQEMKELIQHLRQKIDQAHLVNDDQRSQFEEELRALHTQHDATIAEKLEEIKYLREQIDQTKMVREDEKAHFQEEQRTLQAQHDATITEKAKEVNGLKEKIDQAQTVREVQKNHFQNDIEKLKKTLQDKEEKIKELSARCENLKIQ